MSHADRDDVEQEVVLVLWRSQKADINATYVYRVAWHRALENLQRKRRQSTQARSGAAEPEQRVLLRTAVSRLPPRHQRVCHLLYYEGRTEREAAAILGISRGAVQAITRRALEIMRGQRSAGYGR